MAQWRRASCKGISAPDCKIALSDVAAIKRLFSNFDAALSQNSLGKKGQRLRHFRQDTIAR
jgi:hypothetical protein